MPPDSILPKSAVVCGTWEVGRGVMVRRFALRAGGKHYKPVLPACGAWSWEFECSKDGSLAGTYSTYNGSLHKLAQHWYAGTLGGWAAERAEIAERHHACQRTKRHTHTACCARPPLPLPGIVHTPPAARGPLCRGPATAAHCEGVPPPPPGSKLVFGLSFRVPWGKPIPWLYLLPV